ncbi:histidine phosphatase superfamily [Podospora appendiculata]|uniref:Histidine phosphatase superfamily n=1 Tax=Podospora appendiculata TaxID=314037 RepID=A0AAE0X7Q5_9PEZI|nr:histidine phosphatase superfamily [Podospora appendiculata]
MQLVSLLVLAPSLPLAAAETVLGAFIFHRHGDRTTKSYTPVTLTPLGAEQVFTSGSWYRDNYISADAPSRINGVSSDLAVLSQLSITSSIDNVLQNSAQVFLQGLYPPAGNLATQKLANGSSINSPLNGYQYIPVNAVTSPTSGKGAEETNGWLQAGSGCTKAIASSNSYFQSAEYLATLDSTQEFYQSLLPVYNATFPSPNATFKNAYTIYDFVHVSTIHNTTSTIPSHDLLTPSTLHQLQTLADAHEFGLAYNASSPIRAIAGSVLAAQIVSALNTTLSAPAGKKSAQKLTTQFGAYGTFMAFFGLAGAPAASPDFYGVVDYASSFVFELVTNASLPAGAVDTADVSVRFLFTNGSASATNVPKAYPLFGRAETTLRWDVFVEEMDKFAIGTTAVWCQACGNTDGICSPASLGVATADDGGDGAADGGVSRPVAGVIGAVVAIAVILAVQGLIMLIGGLRLAKKETVALAKKASHDGVSVSTEGRV